MSPDQCIVDGTLDGLLPGETHLVQVHEYGDLSSGCDNCGDVLGMMKRSQEGQVSGCGHCYYYWVWQLWRCTHVLGMMKGSKEGQFSGCGHCYCIKQY